MPKGKSVKPIQVRLASGRQFEVKRTVQRAQRKPTKVVPTRSMVGLAKRSRNPDVKSSVLTANRTRVTGTEFLTTVTGVTTATAGTTLVTTLISPHSLGVGRLAAFSSLYEKYRFHRFRIRYVPIANATVSGQVMGYYDTDPAEVPITTSALQAFQRGVAHYGARTNNVWEERVFELKDDEPNRLLYCNTLSTSEASDRQVFQARFSMLAASALTAVALGNLYVDYEVEFNCPQIDSAPVFGSGAKWTSAGTVGPTNLLGTAPQIAAGTNINLLRVEGDDNALIVPAGSYIAIWRAAGTTLTGAGMLATGPVTTQVHLPDYVYAGGGGCMALLKVKATGAWVLTVAATGAAFGTGSLLYVATMPPDLITSPSMRDVPTYVKSDIKQSVLAAPVSRPARAVDADGELVTGPTGVVRLATCYESDYTMVRKKQL